MPYRSEAQRRYLHVKAPEVAAKWDRKYGSEIHPKKRKIRRKK
jgi:hypothetical protein